MKTERYASRRSAAQSLDGRRTGKNSIDEAAGRTPQCTNKRQLQSSITREHIVQVTEQAIHDLGMARVTTKRIAEIAGVAEGTIFRHFESKNNLVLAALQRRGLPTLEIPGPDTAGLSTIGDNLANAARSLLRYYGDVIPSIVAALADIGLLPNHRRWLREHSFGCNRLAETIRAYVTREQRLGRIRADIEPAFVAETLLGSCLRQAFGQIFYGDSTTTRSDQDFADKLANQLMAAIARQSDQTASGQ